MRLGHVLPGRPEYYDRNPVSRTQVYYNTNIAPHGGTVRWSYTVPTGKKALIEHGRCEVIRDGAAGAVGPAETSIQFQPSGGSNTFMNHSRIDTNAVGDKYVDGQGYVGAILAGDVMAGTTSDGSTGGTCTYLNNSTILEFDA